MHYLLWGKIFESLGRIFRYLPAFKGKFRLARFLLKHYSKQTRDVIISGQFGLNYKVPNIHESIGFELFINGAYELDNIKLIISKIPQNGVFIDIGANVGSISIPISKLRPDIKIYSIEASPRVFAYLQYNVEVNGCSNIRIENRALSNVDNQFVPFYSPEELFGKGSFSPVFTDIPEQVQTIKLDTFITENSIEMLDFIKIDVEGYEKTVLAGGEGSLSGTNSPCILFEFSDFMESQVENSKAGDCQEFLMNLGYKLFNVSIPAKPVYMPNVVKQGFYMILAIKD